MSIVDDDTNEADGDDNGSKLSPTGHPATQSARHPSKRPSGDF